MRDLTAFNQRLASTFGADYVMRWDGVTGRYALDSLSAAGKPITQYWCWFTTDPDPVTGLHPFRDLDRPAEDEIIRNLQRSYIGATGHGLIDWQRDQAVRRQYNEALRSKRVRERAETFAALIEEVAINRPYLKHHSGSKVSRRLAYEGGA